MQRLGINQQKAAYGLLISDVERVRLDQERPLRLIVVHARRAVCITAPPPAIAAA